MHSTAASPTQARGRPRPLPKPLSHVEIAEAGDFQDLVRFLQKMRDELVCDDDDLLIAMTAALVSKSGGMSLIVRGQKAAAIEASMGLRFARTAPLSRAYQIQCVWNLVLPEYRNKTGHARSLLMKAKEIAGQLGVPLYVEETWGSPCYFEIIPNRKWNNDGQYQTGWVKAFLRKLGYVGERDLNEPDLAIAQWENQHSPKIKLCSRHLDLVRVVFSTSGTTSA